MKILIVGQGGREHCLGWALARDRRVKKLWFAPGNAGTSELGENVNIAPSEINALVQWAEILRPDLIVVGPEAPLCLGLVDRLQASGLKVFGPNQSGARLEGSKAFTKELLFKAGIPTAQSERFTDSAKAKAYSQRQSFPQVIKADGLAAGKGVVIALDAGHAETAISEMMDHRIFGDAGSEILIEEFLEGQEVSVHALTDGKTWRLLPSAQDHKRVFDQDQGPNTGGMGAYAPAPLFTPELQRRVEEEIIQPVVDALRREGIDYRGVLYAGLMITKDGPKVLEFNSRFGDPETQVLLPLLETPLLDILLAVVAGNLDQQDFKIKKASALAVVLAAPGYPEKPELGGLIQGLRHADAKGRQMIFHAGTVNHKDGVQTAGGRVLAVSGVAETLEGARALAYEWVGEIHFPGAHYRKDIGAKALNGNSSAS